MNIAVCVKQIPDPATPYELDGENHWVVRPNDQVLDDTDRVGVEVGSSPKRPKEPSPCSRCPRRVRYKASARLLPWGRTRQFSSTMQRSRVPMP